MIDIHVHLSGSMRPETIVEYAKEEGVPLPTYNAKELESFLRAPDKCIERSEYYDLCDLTDWVLQDRRSVRRTVCELVKDLDAQGILYAEIRFSPSQCTVRGMRQEHAVEAAVEGLQRGIRESRHIKANLILTVHPAMDERETFETIVEAEKYLGRGVCGLDILIDEQLYETEVYDWMFKLIKDENIPFTVHAGEYGVKSIAKAIAYGARRISQSVKLLEDKQLMEVFKEKHIVLEMCPMTAIKLDVVPAYTKHPIRRLYDEGILVCVGSDHQRVSGSTLMQEYRRLEKYLGFSREDVYQMNLNAIEGAFISEVEKEDLRKALSMEFGLEKTPDSEEKLKI